MESFRSCAAGNANKLQKTAGRPQNQYGRLEFQRMNKFMTLRDAYDSTKLILPNDKMDIKERVKHFISESVINVGGMVIGDQRGQENNI